MPNKPCVIEKKLHWKQLNHSIVLLPMSVPSCWKNIYWHVILCKDFLAKEPIEIELNSKNEMQIMIKVENES